MKLKRPLPKGAVLGGIVGAGLFVLLIGWFGLVRPQSHKAASLVKQTAAVQQEISTNLAQIAAQKTASAVPAAPQIRVADVYKLAKAMPSNVDMPDILLELDQVARDAGVELQAISPSPPTPDGKINLGLTVTGDFFTITDLLYRLRNFVSVRNGALEASGRLFDVDNLNISPSGKSKVSASIALHTYQYVPAAPVAPVAPVVPASTDTSSTSTSTGTTTTPSPDTPPSGPSAAGAP
jgi:Tfp pilus assembly protein PilO